MTKRTLATLDPDRHARAAAALLSGDTALEFHGTTGDCYRSAPGRVVLDPDQVRFDADDPLWTVHADGVRSRALADGEQLYALDLHGDDDAPIGSLLLRLRTGVDGTHPPAAIAVGPVIRTLGDWFTSEYELNRELDLMAGEVVDRYEELSLVYQTEDNIHYFLEGNRALEQLAGNCVDYLNVGMAMLLMPDKGISVCHMSTKVPLSCSDAVIRGLEERYYRWMQVHNTSVVVNGPGQAGLTDLWLDLPVKLVVSPVIDGKGGVSGLLAIANPAHRPDFNNGDRNLLSVMAGKAAKIVQSNYDSLTGLMTRDGFEHALFAALSSNRARAADACIMHVNIDRMHLFNDTLGHHAGDDLLRRVARLLRANLRDSDCVARLGGDDFGILLEGCTLVQAQAVGEKFRSLIGELECVVGPHRLDVSASIGVAVLDPAVDSIVQVMAAAEVACAAAKDMGRNRCYLYTKEDEDVVRRRQQMHWVGRLQRAMRHDRFELHAQLIAPLSRPDDAWHFEVLIRMQGEGDSVLAPGEFLPVAERYHLMPSLDRWVVEHTLGMLSSFRHEIAASGAVCAINVSGQSLSDAGFGAFVLDCLDRSGVPPENVCFEITETAAIANIGDAQVFIDALKRRGCKFSLDDFGAGLSSFAYLKTLDVDYLKIDGCFVRDILEDSVSASMVTAINQMGQIMGLQTIGEFVENDAIRDRLKTLGVDYVQGWGVARPRPLGELLGDLFAGRAVGGLQA